MTKTQTTYKIRRTTKSPQAHQDFEPGEVIVDIRRNQTIHYTVLDPVRTSKGKLRLRGPRGGYTTTWWTRSSLPDNYGRGEIATLEEYAGR